jgi:hypothetical protein
MNPDWTLYFSRKALHFILVTIGLVSPITLIGAPKISVRSTDAVNSYNKMYVVPIRIDPLKVRPGLVERLKKAGFDTVDVTTEHFPFTSQGTGFLLTSEGHVLTCAHIVGKQSDATLWIGTNRYVGRVTASDTNLDLAVILVESNHPAFQPLPLPIAAEYRIGQEVFAMGFPVADLLGSKPRLNKGLISSTAGIGDDEGHVQISIPIQPGNSGSPLLDNSGRVIGMVNATINPMRFFLLEGSMPQNVNFAIKSPPLRTFLEKAKIPLPEGPASANDTASTRSDELFDNVGRSLVLIRAGIIEEERTKERPLLCRCSYLTLQSIHFFRLEIDFVDPKKLVVVLTATLDESTTSSPNKVLDAMFEHICDKVFPDKMNPFNPKKSKKTMK